MLVPTPGEKLAMIRAAWKPPLRQRELADLLSVPLTRVRSWERAGGTVVRLPKEIAQRLAEMKGFDWLWFYDEEDASLPSSMGSGKTKLQDSSPPQMTGRAPLWGVVPAGQWERPEQDVEWIAVPERYARAGHFCLRIQGDSMAPLFVAGDVVIVRETPSPPLGSIVVARNAGKELTIKRLVSTAKGPRLRSENPDYGEVAPEPGIEYVGQVVFMMRDTW